jgi:hypothetical protein
MAVPFTFGTATSSIPLSNLDSNFATVITLGNTAIQLGNTVTTLNNMTLANVTISSGNVTITNVAITTANVTTANITTDNITNGTVITSLTLSYGTANGVAFLNGSKVLTTGTALTFDGTNVGIGTNSPAYKLDIKAASTPTIRVLETTNGPDGRFLASASDVQIGTYGGSPLSFYTNSSEKMRIDTSGNVGIGTSSPSTYANSYGPVLVTGTGNNFATIQGRTDGPSGATNSVSYGGSYQTNPINGARMFVCAAGSAGQRGIITFCTKDLDDNSTQPVERMRIDSSGIVTMSAYGAGAATFSAAGVISSVSDETWKIKDGVPVDPDAMLKKLEPGYWYYNDEKKETFGVDRQLGFYAQNVNAAIGPEAAPTPEEGKPWGYYDRSVLAVTVMSLQKALATIESLTARITALEST